MLTLLTLEDYVPQGAPSAERLDALTRALQHERALIDNLRQALLRQRAAVAAHDPQAIEVSVHAIGRTLLTLEEARRLRLALLDLIGAPVPLAELERVIGGELTPAFRAACQAVRRAAEDTAREVAINQNILRRAIWAGDVFLQQLFSSVSDLMPACAPGPAAEPPAAGPCCPIGRLDLSSSIALSLARTGLPRVPLGPVGSRVARLEPILRLVRGGAWGRALPGTPMSGPRRVEER